MRFTALGWNLFHGRDFPPDPRLFTWRSRLFRVTERNETHLQVNRDLTCRFAALLAGTPWDVALLQECPPRFTTTLARTCGAQWHRAFTSRNSLGALRTYVARLNPDLVASAGGGSNLTLVRVAGPLGGITARRDVVIHAGWPQRRTMALTRTESGLCVANLHATNNPSRLAAEDVLYAANAAVEWAREAPLVFGGDLNLRPADDSKVFDELQDRFGLGPTPLPCSIDHLLVRGMEVISPAQPWPPERREVRNQGLALRLSDHAPVEATFST